MVLIARTCFRLVVGHWNGSRSRMIRLARFPGSSEPSWFSEKEAKAEPSVYEDSASPTLSLSFEGSPGRETADQTPRNGSGGEAGQSEPAATWTPESSMLRNGYRLESLAFPRRSVAQ